MKAELQEASVPFKKIHDLEILLKNVVQIQPIYNNLQASASSLTIYAVKFRYPGEEADKAEAKEAVKNCRLIRKTVRQSFNLSTAD